MKLSFGILVNVVYSELADDTWYGGAVNDRQVERGLYDLHIITAKTWRKGGAGPEGKFDPAKHLTYGCHCSIGSSHVPTGQPVDAFDQACRHHTQCLNCVRDKHGEDCNHDTVQYTYRYSFNQNFVGFESKSKSLFYRFIETHLRFTGNLRKGSFQLRCAVRKCEFPGSKWVEPRLSLVLVVNWIWQPGTL